MIFLMFLRGELRTAEILLCHFVLCDDVLVSWGCHNKTPQTGWLKSNRNVFPHILETWNIKSSVSRALFPLKALEKNSSVPLPSFGGPRSSLFCSSVTSISDFIVTCLFPYISSVSLFPSLPLLSLTKTF